MTNYQLIKLEKYSTFDSITEMDHVVRQFNAQLSKSHYETLNLLKQYSCKVIGVSHLKIETIAKQLNKSISTIKRHLAYLKEIGMISIVNTSRVKKGGKGANVYVINSFEIHQKIKNDLLRMSYRDKSKKHAQSLARQAMEFVKVKKQTIDSLSYINLFSTRERKRKSKLQRIENIKHFRSCPSNVPENVYMLNRTFFSDSQISAMYKIISKQLNQYPLLSAEQREDITLIAFKSVVKAMRKHYRHGTAPIKNMYAYVCKTAQRQAFLMSSQNMFDFVF